MSIGLSGRPANDAAGAGQADAQASGQKRRHSLGGHESADSAACKAAMAAESSEAPEQQAGEQRELERQPRQSSSQQPPSAMGVRRRPSLKPLNLSGLGRAGTPDHEGGVRLLQAKGYEVGELIGSGIVGKVYKVKRSSDGSALAAKHVFTADEEVRAQAQAEHAVMARLRHHSILRVETLLESPGGLWICMECCEGGTVQRRVESHGPWEELQGRPLLQQLVEGVDYLHQRRIVHRDLKPENLLLCKGETALKIGDFNCAKRLNCDTAHTTMLTHRGTPLYSAPEIRFGWQWNERVDVWAAGLCASFVLQAALPFSAEGPGVVEALTAGALPELHWNGLSESARGLILECLEVDMRMRPAPMELLDHAFFGGAAAAAVARSSEVARSCRRKARRHATK